MKKKVKKKNTDARYKKISNCQRWNPTIIKIIFRQFLNMFRVKKGNNYQTIVLPFLDGTQ